MRTVRMKVYRFQELSEQAKQKVLNDFSDINVDHNWWDFIYQDAEQIGIKITGFDTWPNKHCTGNFINQANDTAELIKTEISQDKKLISLVSVFEDKKAKTPNCINEDQEERFMLSIERDFLSGVLNYYADVLDESYNYSTSDESIIETIEANEYEFTSDGKRYAK